MRFKMKKHDDENDVNLDKPHYMTYIDYNQLNLKEHNEINNLPYF